MLHWPKKSLVMPFYYINFDQNGPPYIMMSIWMWPFGSGVGGGGMVCCHLIRHF